VAAARAGAPSASASWAGSAPSSWRACRWARWIEPASAQIDLIWNGSAFSFRRKVPQGGGERRDERCPRSIVVPS